MRTWLNFALQVTLVVGVAGIAVSVIRWLGRCRHPNPHYIRARLTPSDGSGGGGQLEPAKYCCYECGKTWLAVSRDPAWHPTRQVQRFSGFDQHRAEQAAARAAVEEKQHRVLAGRRAAPAGPPVRRQERSHQPRPAQVVEMHSRRRT